MCWIQEIIDELHTMQLLQKIYFTSNDLNLNNNTKQSDEAAEAYVIQLATLSWLSIPTPNHIKEYLNVDINIAFECN